MLSAALTSSQVAAYGLRSTKAIISLVVSPNPGFRLHRFWSIAQGMSDTLRKPSKRAFQTCMGHGEGGGASKKKSFKPERRAVRGFGPIFRKSGPGQARVRDIVSGFQPQARGCHLAESKFGLGLTQFQGFRGVLD